MWTVFGAVAYPLGVAVAAIEMRFESVARMAPVAVGVMDVRAMAVVTAAITVERVAPASESVARTIGVAPVAIRSVLVARGAGLG